MFFDIESDLDDKRYVTLMFILNASEDEARLGIEIETLRQSLRTSCATAGIGGHVVCFNKSS